MNFSDTPWLQNSLAAAGLLLLVHVIIRSFSGERGQRAWLNLKANRTGIAACAIISLYLIVGVLDIVTFSNPDGKRVSLLDRIAEQIPKEKSYSAPLASTTLSLANPKPLNGKHLLGTDSLGRDTFIQTLKGTRTALLIGGLTSAIYVPIGVMLGVLAGYFRGRVDDLIQYLYSTIASVPEILMLIAILMVLGKGIGTMAIALGVTGWVGLARLIRGETLRQAERPYLSAARALGQSHWKIITRHLLPNVMHLIFIRFVLGFSGLVLAEATLSYLGVGSPVGVASWGSMIDASRSELSREPLVWWNLAASAGSLFVLVLSLNLFGDALRKAFDPRAR